MKNRIFIKMKIYFSFLRSKYSYNEDEVSLFLVAQGSFPEQPVMVPSFLRYPYRAEGGLPQSRRLT